MAVMQANGFDFVGGHGELRPYTAEGKRDGFLTACVFAEADDDAVIILAQLDGTDRSMGCRKGKEASL